MKNVLRKFAAIAGLIVFIVITTPAFGFDVPAKDNPAITVPEKGQLTTFVFEFDVPVKDGHVVTVEALVDYRLINDEVILFPDEVEDRIYSNVTTAFRLATTGVPFEKIREDSGGEQLEDKVLTSIEYYNGSPHEVVEIESLEFSMTFDPPASELDPCFLE